MTDRTSLNNCYYVSINGKTYYYEDYVKGLQEELEVYVERIDKAIEYIKNCTMGGDNVYVDNIELEELLEILGDKE